VGYDYMNLHLGLDFGSRRFVFFLHGGMSILRGHIHNVDAAIRGATAHDTSVAGTTEVTVRQDPSVKAVGSSVKLGFILYIW
jgi:FtsZ-interacting cell division protein YlmF